MVFRQRDLTPQPFTGMLNAVDREAARNEDSVACAAKLGLERPEGAFRQARALRAVERILVGTERFWDCAPASAMSLKEMISRHEASMATRPVANEEQTS